MMTPLALLGTLLFLSFSLFWDYWNILYRDLRADDNWQWEAYLINHRSDIMESRDKVTRSIVDAIDTVTDILREQNDERDRRLAERKAAPQTQTT